MRQKSGVDSCTSQLCNWLPAVHQVRIWFAYQLIDGPTSTCMPNRSPIHEIQFCRKKSREERVGPSDHTSLQVGNLILQIRVRYNSYGIYACLLRYIRERWPEINIFSDPPYAGFQKTLDSETKRLCSTGLGVQEKQAEPVTVEEENTLWEKGLL